MPTFTWSGGAPKTLRGWGNAANWKGGSTPASSEPVALEFPTLTSANCTSAPPTDTCYESENNVSGLNVESLRIEDSQTYVIAGDPIILGSGGLAAEPTTNTTEQIGSILALPIALGVPQTWNILGQSGDAAIDGNQLMLLEEVSGSSRPLEVRLSEGGGLVLANNVEVGALSLEGAESNRAGILNGVVELVGAQLDASDHEPVSFNHVFVIGTGATGPLTTNAAEVVVETGEKKAERLEVQSLTLDPQSRLTFAVNGTGVTAGYDYSQLSSTGAVDLNGAELAIVAPTCKALSPYQSYVLITTTGTIGGGFGNVGEGKEVPIMFPKGCAVEQMLSVKYEKAGGTQMVIGTVIPGPTSTTSLEVSPSNPVTYQSVTLTATVHASSETPSGSVRFNDGNNRITACSGELVLVAGVGYTATCQTSFTASGSPHHLSAEFMPSLYANLRGSFTTDDLTVGQGPTTTSLQISPTVTSVDQYVLYTATVSTSTNSTYASVSPLGGTVLFADGGTPIGSCSAQPLQRGVSSSLTATCLLSYLSQGVHSITASYSGDPNFATSSSSAQRLTVQPSLDTNLLEESEPGDAKLDGTNILVYKRTVAVVKLTCHGNTSCKGTLTLSVREAVKRKRGKKTFRLVKIGSGAFSIAAGKIAGIGVHLNARGRALLASHHRQISASLQLTQDSGTTRHDLRLVETSRGKKKG
jgi:hypothetical protein